LIVFQGVKSLPTGHDRVLGLGQAGRVPWATGLFYAAGHTWVKEMGRRRCASGSTAVPAPVPRMDSIQLVPWARSVSRQALAEIGTGHRRGHHRGAGGRPGLGFNPVLSRHPDLARRDSYRRGWLATSSR